LKVISVLGATFFNFSSTTQKRSFTSSCSFSSI